MNLFGMASVLGRKRFETINIASSVSPFVDGDDRGAAGCRQDNVGPEDVRRPSAKAVQHHRDGHAHRQDEGDGAASQEQLQRPVGRAHLEGVRLPQQALQHR